MDPYKQTNSYSIEKGCPWYEAQQSYGPPNIDWCEPSHCSVFDEPANTWSNLIFLIAFFYLYKKINDSFIRFYAVTLFFVGLFSALYHASNNAFSQFFDFVGMYLMTSIILAFNTNRTKALGTNIYSQFWFFAFLNMVLFMSFEYMEIPIQWTVALNVFATMFLEIFNGIKEQSFRHYKYFYFGFFFLVLAQSCAMIDLNRIYCNPNNHVLHGHVFWHIFNGISLTFIGLHMFSIRKFLNEKKTS
jgi:hypothetical protein